MCHKLFLEKKFLRSFEDDSKFSSPGKMLCRPPVLFSGALVTDVLQIWCIGATLEKLEPPMMGKKGRFANKLTESMASTLPW